MLVEGGGEDCGVGISMCACMYVCMCVYWGWGCRRMGRGGEGRDGPLCWESSIAPWERGTRVEALGV